MWQKIKNLSSRFSNFLYKNKGSVYTGCFLVIIFTVLSMNSEIRHTGNLIESEKEKIWNDLGKTLNEQNEKYKNSLIFKN